MCLPAVVAQFYSARTIKFISNLILSNFYIEKEFWGNSKNFLEKNLKSIYLLEFPQKFYAKSQK
jgi:hypothetical protein